MGKFKGWVDILTEEEKKSLEESKKNESILPSHFRQEMISHKYDSHFIQKREVMIRVYICTAEGLPSMDKGSYSDPYVQMRLGKNRVNVINKILILKFTKIY